MTWHPRGEVTWPNWRTAEPGTRVQNVRTGRTGTFVQATSGYAVIDWDVVHAWQIGPSRGRVVAPAFDLRPIA